MMQTRGAGGRVIDLGEDLAAVGEKLFPGRRQANAAVGAGEQTRPGLLLKDLNLLT